LVNSFANAIAPWRGLAMERLRRFDNQIGNSIFVVFRHLSSEYFPRSPAFLAAQEVAQSFLDQIQA